MTTNTHASKGALRLTATLLLGTMLATAAHAETLTVTDLVTSTGPNNIYGLSIPSVEVTDGNLSEADIHALFAVASYDDLSRWAGVTAKSVKIPSITFHYMFNGAPGDTPVEETITYQDIELIDVVDGVAASTLVGGAEVDAPNTFNITFGKMSSGRFDIGGLLGFYGIGGAPSSTEMKEIYDGFTFTGGSLLVGTEASPVFKCDIGSAATGRFIARPLKTSMADVEEIMARLQKLQTTDPSATPDPADLKTLVGYYTDLLTAFSSDPGNLDGFSCSGTDPVTKKTFTVASGKMDIGAFEPAIYPSISLNNFNFTGDEGFLKFGNFTWKNMDLHGPIDALNGAETLDAAWFTANWRKLIPAMDGLNISDVSFDLPNGATPDARSKGTAGVFDITLGKYVNGLPSEIALALDDAVIPLPAETTASPIGPQLAARGITSITSDTLVKLHWDEASNTIIVDELLSNSDQFGRIAITGTIGNATPALFSSDDREAMMAGMGLTVKDLKIDLEDYGLYGLVLTASSAQSGQPLQASRIAISGMVQGMTLAILGSDPSALAAVGELGKFLSGANSKVSITLTAKDGAGLSLADLSALEKDPTVLAGKVTVTAVASGDPVPQVEVAPAPAPTPPADPSLSLEEQKRDLKAPAQQ